MNTPFVDNDGNPEWKRIGYHARSAFAVILSLAVILGGAWFGFDKVHTAYVNYKSVSDYQGDGDKDITVTIPSGASGGQIGSLLVSQGVVKSSKAFLKAYDANPQATSIQAGTYKLKTQIPAATAVTMLLDPSNVVKNLVTVPEGMWMSDQLALLAKKTGISLAQYQAAAANPQALGLPSYVKTSEGFLFPSTYDIGQHPTAVSVLTLMAKQYNAIAAKYDLEDTAKKLGYTPLQVITVASILQAEARSSDQAMVAGIIYNRLKQNIPLGLDSTAHYLLKVPMNKALPANFATLQTSSSYNTYANTGLPAGPIDAPGEAAIKAALNPTKSDYLFWVTVNLKTGETLFAKTNAEQNANTQKFVAWCKANGNPGGCPAS